MPAAPEGPSAFMESFGHYTILERLPSGAMGELARARDVRLGRTVALRIVSQAISSDASSREAILAAAAAATALSHPHIAALFDFGEEGGRVFLAHEYATGQSLRGHLAGRPIDSNLVLELAVQLADAVAEGHRQGVVHGNLSPSTIFLTPTDKTKIIGFGFAAWTSGGLERKAIADALAAGQDPASPSANGVVPYMAPEQLLSGRAEPRSDVFSLGVVIYEMLTGRAPFGSDTAGATAVKVLQGTPPPASRQNAALPSGFDAILTKALAKSLDARYGSAAEMAADLRALARQLNVNVTAEIQHGRAMKPARPRGPALKRIAIGLLVLALLGALAAAAWFWRDRIAGLFTRAGPVPQPILLVVPFQTPETEQGTAYYGVGFAEDLAARLGEVPGLTVVGRSSITEAASGTLAERAARVGAILALRGTTRSGPASLRVDVELVEAATGRVLWSEGYTREPRQALGTEAEIALQVADRLRLPTPSGNGRLRAQARQVDPGAYDLYLQARAAAASRDRSRAIGLFRRAIELDPKLTEARVALSQALYYEDFYAGSEGDPQALVHAREEAEAALAVGPEMPGAYLAAALSAATTGAAASSLARALSLDPSCGEAWHHAGDLVVEGDPLRAIAYYRRALELDPAIDSSHRDIAAAYEMLDRLPEAEAELAAGESARPDRPWWMQMRARIEIVRQNYDNAVEILAGEPGTESAPFAWLVGRVIPLAMASRREMARGEAVKLTDRYPWFCEGQAVLASVEWDGDGKARARTLADAIFARGDAPNRAPQLLQCEAMAAAATGDGPGAANYVGRMAADESALRLWMREGVFSAAFSFRRGLYPWTKVRSSAPFSQAGAALAQSLGRIRDDVARRLPAPPQSHQAVRKGPS
jgi:eukaryotic-like serine/threonine-protein kinase